MMVVRLWLVARLAAFRVALIAELEVALNEAGLFRVWRKQALMFQTARRVDVPAAIVDICNHAVMSGLFLWDATTSHGAYLHVSI